MDMSLAFCLHYQTSGDYLFVWMGYHDTDNTFPQTVIKTSGVTDIDFQTSIMILVICLHNEQCSSTGEKLKSQLNLIQFSLKSQHFGVK